MIGPGHFPQRASSNASHGVVSLLKPPGMTSHDAVAHVRRVLQIKRVGHTGTLDPAAAGVLPICVGQATRLVEALQTGSKEYLAEATFGYETDTLDAVGQTVRECVTARITRADVEGACAAFGGQIQQQPPMHSAIKIGGQKLYEIARSGANIDVPSRTVEISALEVTHFFEGERPRAFLRVECSSGTYIRSLVRDIGRAMENAATMTFLSRARNGLFSLQQSVTPQEFEFAPVLIPISAVLHQLYGASRIDDDITTALWQGKRVAAAAAAIGGQKLEDKSALALSLWSNTERTVWALARRESAGEWKPEKVFDLRAG